MSEVNEPLIADRYCISLLDQLQEHPLALAGPLFARAPVHEGSFVVNATKQHAQRVLGKEALRLTVEPGKLTVARVTPEPIQIVHLNRANWEYTQVLSEPADELVLVRESQGWGLKDDTPQVTDRAGFLTFWFQIADRSLQRLNKH